MQLRTPNRKRRAVSATLSAPTGGLNGRDSYTDMPATDAFVMDNWFPYNTSVDTRNGCSDYATGLPGPVESLEVYTGAAGSKMLAFSNGGIYNVTLGGAVGAALAAGKNSNRVTSAMFSNAGSQFLLIYSGADQPLSYDGAALTGLNITGLTGSQNTLFGPHVFKGRVFLAQQGQLGFYYLGVGAIQGAASYFDLAQQSLRGGAMACITSFSQESMGSGPQDYAVFATTEGEYILYAGTDPSNAANWALVGRYVGPPPIGRKGWFKFRSDVYFITQEGILSLTQIRQMGEDNESDKYITSKLGRQFDDISTAYNGVHGWCAVIYPRGNALYVNMPMTGATTGPYCQYVMNTNTNAWSRFLGWDALTWAVFNGRAYFGTNGGKVVLADEGYQDNGAQINAVCRQAWNTFDDNNGMGQADKQFHFAAFALAADGAPALSCALNTNFEDDRPTYLTSTTAAPGAAWDLAVWDEDSWAGGALTQTITVSVGKLGYIASPWMQVSPVGAPVRWFASRITLEKSNEVLL